MAFPKVNNETDFHVQSAKGAMDRRFGLTFYEPKGDMGRNARTFVQDVQQAWRDVIGAHLRIKADPTMNPAQKAMKAASIAETRRNALQDRFESIAPNYERFIRGKQAELNKHLEPPSLNVGKALQDQQLRDLVRNEPNPAQQLAMSKEPAYRAAIARGPRVLSGLSEEAFKNAKDGYLAEVAPDDFAACVDARDGLLLAAGAMDQLDRDFRATIPFAEAEAANGKVYVEPAMGMWPDPNPQPAAA